jgi:hypothetical protein
LNRFAISCGNYPSLSLGAGHDFDTRYAQDTKDSKLCTLRAFVFILVGGYAAPVSFAVRIL